jgi:hypothetical protein
MCVLVVLQSLRPWSGGLAEHAPWVFPTCTVSALCLVLEGHAGYLLFLLLTLASQRLQHSLIEAVDVESVFIPASSALRSSCRH